MTLRRWTSWMQSLQVRSGAKGVRYSSALSGRRQRRMEREFGYAWRYLGVQPTSLQSQAEGTDTNLGFSSRAPLPPPFFVSTTPPCAVTSSGSSSNHDPLERFLSEHKEEGPTFLAMWTSLHRSCLFRSEISDRLAMAVRTCFHKLIRSRAVDAAVVFYWKLVELGVSLRNSDLALLLSNLPYDRSASSGVEAESDSWLQSDSPTRESWMRRKSREAEAAAKKVKNNESGKGTSTSTVHSSATSTTDVGMIRKGENDRLSSTSATTSSPLQAARRSERWLERWMAYEAAMGHVVFSDIENDSTLSESMTHRVNDDKANAAFIQDERQGDVLPSTSGASQCRSLLNHLVFLHRSDSSQASHRSKKQHAALKKIPVVCRMNTRSIYWAEALHVASSFLSQDALSSQKDPTHQSSQRETKKHISSSLATALLDSIRCAPTEEQWKCGSALFSSTRTIRQIETDVALLSSVSLAHSIIQGPRPWTMLRAQPCVLFHEYLSKLHNDEAPRSASRATSVIIRSLELRSAKSASHLCLGAQDAMSTLGAACEAAFVESCAAKQKRMDMLHSGLKTPSFTSQGMHEGIPEHVEGGGCRVIPLELELSLTLVTDACQLLAPFVNLAAATREKGNNITLEDFVRRHIIGDGGLFRCWEMFYVISEHTHHGEYKAVMNGGERSHVSAVISIAGLSFLATISRQGSSLSLTTVNILLTKTIESLKLVFPRDRSAQRRLIAKAAASALRMVGITNKSHVMKLKREISDRSDGKVLLVSNVARLAMMVVADRRSARGLYLSQQGIVIRSILGLCTAESSFGRHVRTTFTASDLRRLDGLLNVLRCPGRLRRPSHYDPSPSMPQPSTAASINVVLLKRAAMMSGKELDRLKHHRSLVEDAYAHVSRCGRDHAALSKYLCQSFKQKPWRDVTETMHILLHSLRVSRGLLSLDVFDVAIDSLTRNQRPTQVQGKDIIDDTWSAALRLFWNAVDHVSPPVTLNKNDSNKGSEEEGRRWLNVLNATLASLLRVCVATHRRDVGRQWNEHWQRLHGMFSNPDTLGSESFLRQKLEHSVILRERDALSRILYFIHPQHGASTVFRQEFKEILLDAVQHECRRGRWKQAIEMISSSHHRHRGGEAPASAGLEDVFCNSPERSVAFLVCLSHAPSPLYHTAMKVFEHIPRSVWTMDHSVYLLRILTKARRWQDALAVVSSDALRQHHMNDALVLEQGLRACAIGGRAQEAETLYDRFKELTWVPSPREEEETTTAAMTSIDAESSTSCSYVDENLSMVSPGTTTTQQQQGLPLVMRHREVNTSLAKALFLRAFTKNIVKRSNLAESANRDAATRTAAPGTTDAPASTANTVA